MNKVGLKARSRANTFYNLLMSRCEFDIDSTQKIE